MDAAERSLYALSINRLNRLHNTLINGLKVKGINRLSHDLETIELNRLTRLAKRSLKQLYSLRILTINVRNGRDFVVGNTVTFPWADAAEGFNRIDRFYTGQRLLKLRFQLPSKDVSSVL